MSDVNLVDLSKIHPSVRPLVDWLYGLDDGVKNKPEGKTGFRNGVIPRAAIVRLQEKLVLDVGTGCQVFSGAKNPKGYGYISVGNRRNRPAHRVAYEAMRGPIPPGMTIDHLCRNKACCNPDHLEVVTREENGRRQADPTQCPHGHAVSTENTRYDARGHRLCRVCKQIRDARRRAKLRDEPIPDALPHPQQEGGA